jgi:hypothetical protein
MNRDMFAGTRAVHECLTVETATVFGIHGHSVHRVDDFGASRRPNVQQRLINLFQEAGIQRITSTGMVLCVRTFVNDPVRTRDPSTS